MVLDHDIIDGKSLGSDIRKNLPELELKTDDDSHVVCVERGAEYLTRKPSTRSRSWRSGHYGSVSQGQDAQAKVGLVNLTLV